MDFDMEIQQLMRKGAFFLPSTTSALDTGSLIAYNQLKELLETAYYAGHAEGYSEGYDAGYSEPNDD